MNKVSDLSVIVTAIINREPIGANITLKQFRDIYHQVKGHFNTGHFLWILIFMGEKVYAQPIGFKETLLEICESKPCFYRIEDFDFLTPEQAAIYGTSDGKYTYWQFLKDVFSIKWIAVQVIVLILLTIFTYSFLSPKIIQNVSGALINALAIFVSIFSLFVLSVNPDTHFRFAESSRFHRLSQSDKYIGFLGLSTLGLTIISSALASGFETLVPSIKLWSEIRFLQSVFFSLSIIGTLISLWLVLGYHFERKHEMTGMIMAKNIISNQQKLFEEQLSPPRRIK